MTYWAANDPEVLRRSAEASRESAAQRERQRAADAAEETSETTAGLLEAMRASLTIAEQTREDAQRSERHSRIISWSSLAIAVASLAAAIAAIVMPGR